MNTLPEESPLSEETARAIFMLLAKFCEVPPWDGGRFVRDQVSSYQYEWRFHGNLGFGGKLKRRGHRIFVDCYPEDLTPSRKQTIKIVNTELAKFQAHGWS